MTTPQELSEWFDEGVDQKATHMVVICDTWDYDDYPAYFDSKEEAKDTVNDPGEMQRIMEVYVLDPNRKEEQLAKKRCMNYD